MPRGSFENWGNTMFGKRNVSFAHHGAVAIVWILLLGCQQAVRAEEAPADSTLQFFAMPTTKALRVRELVIEPGGAVWAMGNDAGYVLQGDDFVAPEGIKLLAGQYLTGLWGGPDRGAYATQPGTEEHQGKLLRLRDGQAEEFTSYYYDNATDRPGIYVSKTGQLFNWGERFLATLVGKEWQRIEARFGPRPGMIRPAILDRGELVDFYMASTNTLYRANRGGELREEHGPAWLDAALKPPAGAPPIPRAQATALWGTDRALLVRSVPPLTVAFDLTTLEKVDLAEVNQKLAGFKLYDAFRRHNGDVWLLTQVPGRKEYAVYELTVDGQISEVVKQLPWINTRTFQFPRAVCDLENTGMLFGLEDDGLVVARAGQSVPWNWRQGLTRETPVLAAALDGSFWFANGDQIVHARLGKNPPKEIPQVAEWDSFPLHSNEAFWATAPGELAMIRSDHPKQLSRYSAKGWSTQDLPVETSRIHRSAIDDRGHVLLTFADSMPRYLDIGPEGVTEEKSFGQLLQAAVAAGARTFRAGRTSPAVLLVSPEQLWMINDNHAISRFDGKQWDGIMFRDRVERIFPSAAYDVLFSTRGKYFRYDRGQVIALEVDASQPLRVMFGVNGPQPYDRALYERAKGQYFPAVRSPKGWRMFMDADSFERGLAEAAPKNDLFEEPVAEDVGDAPKSDEPKEETLAKPATVTLGRYFERLTPAASGAWLYSIEGSATPPARLWEGRLIPLDFSGTPLADKYVADVIQDSAGDLWFLAKFNHGAMAVRHQQSQTSLVLPKLPRECGRTLTLPVGIQQGTLVKKVRFARKVDDGPWIVNNNDGRNCRFQFDANGLHRCQVVGLLFGAPIGEPLSFEIDATDSIPDTRIDAGAFEAALPKDP